MTSLYKLRGCASLRNPGESLDQNRGAESMLAEAFAARTLFVYRSRKNAPRAVCSIAEGSPLRRAYTSIQDVEDRTVRDKPTT